LRTFLSAIGSGDNAFPGRRFRDVLLTGDRYERVSIGSDRNYVGHAEAWDELAIDGEIATRDCVLRYKRNGRVLAVASIYCDADSLMTEAAMEYDAMQK
jgi:hypothetical protein